MKISVTILTKNSERYLQEVLAALTAFDEVLLYDSGSEDHTFAIAKAFANVKVYKGVFEGFGKTHNKASSLAKHPWILSIDSDEVLTKEACEELKALLLTTSSVYSFPRKNYFNNKWIRWCGWHPDRVVRLYHREVTRFSDAEVHEAVKTNGVNRIELQGPLKHYSYASTADFLTKMQLYSDLFAEQMVGKKTSSLPKALGHAFFAFFKSYILKRGFMGGAEGFIISNYQAQTAYYKYLKLRERTKHY